MLVCLYALRGFTRPSYISEGGGGGGGGGAVELFRQVPRACADPLVLESDAYESPRPRQLLKALPSRSMSRWP